MSVCTAVILIVGKEVINPRLAPKIKGVPIPFELVVVIMGILCSYFIGRRNRNNYFQKKQINKLHTELNRVYKVNIVGRIPPGIPPLRIPDFNFMPTIVGEAVVIGVVAFALTISLAKLFAKRDGYRIDDSQEPYAYGEKRYFYCVF
jgi:MFS superfamily sulfate permease-like transporter